MSTKVSTSDVSRKADAVAEKCGLKPRDADLLAERERGLPVWIRAPKRGPEFYSGFTRPKLYELVASGHIRSCSIRERGRIRGVRLFDLQSILDYIERHCSRP